MLLMISDHQAQERGEKKMEKKKKLAACDTSVSMIAVAFTALPLSASAEGEQNSGEEVTATVSPSTTVGVTTTGEPVATATTEVESTDEPATAATPEATGVALRRPKNQNYKC